MSDPLVERLKPEHRDLYMWLREHGDPLTGRPMTESQALSWLVERGGRVSDLYEHDSFDYQVATWQDLHESLGATRESARRAGVRDALATGGWRSEDQARAELREARRLKESRATPPTQRTPSSSTRGRVVESWHPSGKPASLAERMEALEIQIRNLQRQLGLDLHEQASTGPPRSSGQSRVVRLREGRRA